MTKNYRPFQVGKVITPNQPWTHLGSCSIGTHPSVSMGNLDARKSCGGKLGRGSFVQHFKESGKTVEKTTCHLNISWWCETRISLGSHGAEVSILGCSFGYEGSILRQGWYWQPWDLIVCLYQASLHQPNLPDVHENYPILTHARSCESKCQVSWKCQAFQKGTQGMKCCATRNLRRMAAVGQLKHLLWNTSCHSLEPR